MPAASIRATSPRRRRLVRQLVSYSVAAALYTALAAATFFLGPDQIKALLTAFVVVGGAVVLFSIHTVHADAGAYAEAERQSSRALQRLTHSGWRVVHDVPFGPMNIDHVAIGPRGVVAVESASISSPYPVDEDGGDALEAALRHAKRGARRIRLLLKSQGMDAAVAPALALWGRGSASLATQTVDGVSMLVGRDSKQWSDQLPSTGETFDPHEVAEMEAILGRFVEMRLEQYRRARQESLPA
jgi:hypothetical protein